MADDDGLTLFVRKLPPDIQTKEVENLFSEYGPLSKCFVVPTKDEKAASKGRVAFVTFSLKDDGLQAASAIDKTELRSHSISVEPAKSKRDLKADRPQSFRKLGRKELLRKGVDGGESATSKKARLVVRNVSFSANEDELRRHFEPYGHVSEAKLLRRDDGRLVGCGFVQFRTVPEASRAVKALNAKPFLGRPVAVDWAVPKARFEAAVEDDPEVEDEKSLPATVAIKSEPGDDEGPTKKKRKRNPHRSRGSKRRKIDSGNEEDEKKPQVASLVVVKPDPVVNDNGEGAEYVHSAEEGEEEDEEELDGENFDDEPESASREVMKRNPADVSKDVREGRTVFVDNVPFTSSEEELEDFMTSEFGPVKYALFCLDPVTQHPKGTAFVQFQSLEAAEKCLGANPEALMFDGRQLKVMQAIGRRVASERKSEHDAEKVKPKNDKRNLYLAREGLVREGTQAAEGVSQNDMNVRQQLARNKKVALRDLTMFVSPTRLCVHNVPFGMDDAELRAVFKRYSPRGSVVTECKVMRDRKSGNVSKGYAFVSLSRHEDALEALRTINNNPEVFTATRRPIVEFSIENKLALQAREKRLARSREKNTNNPKLSEEEQRRQQELRRAGKMTRTNAVYGREVDEGAAAAAPPMTKHDKKRLRSLKRFQEKRKRRRLEKELGGADGSGPPAKTPPLQSPSSTSPREKKKMKKIKNLGGAAEHPGGKGQGDFLGAKSDPAKKGQTGLPTHDGPKVRHKTRPTHSISRKLLRKQLKKPEKIRTMPETPGQRPGAKTQRRNVGNGVGSVARKDEGTRRGARGVKGVDKSASDFQSMVETYKTKLTAPANSTLSGKTKWFDG